MGTLVFDGHGQRLVLRDQHHQLFAPGDARIQQCMEGTDNLALCLCALEAFKQVPVDRARLRHHGRDKKLVLHIHEDSMTEMLPEVNECEAQFGQNDG